MDLKCNIYCNIEESAEILHVPKPLKNRVSHHDCTLWQFLSRALNNLSHGAE